jgi:hypothetical protein
MAISFYVVSAILGNFHIESTVNPGIYESLDRIPDSDMTNNNVYGGYGLGQWTNKASLGLTRRTQLIQWLDSNGYTWTDGDAQLDYLLYENYWHQNVGSYSTLTDFLLSTSTNINELTRIYMRNWEGINNNTLSQRQQWANMFYNYIVEHYEDTAITTWYSGNIYLSEAQQKNNAVLVARHLIGGITPPTPPTPPVPSVTDPLIMLFKRNRKKRFY